MRYLGIMHSAEQGHDILRRLWEVAKPELLAGRKLVVHLKDETRNLDQNAAQWPILEAFSQQLKWPINGAMSELSAEDWKVVLSSAFKRESVRVTPGLDGGMVMLGMRTSRMSKREFSDWLEFLHATAAERGVVVYENVAV